MPFQYESDMIFLFIAGLESVMLMKIIWLNDLFYQSFFNLIDLNK